ncbi:nucleotide-binding domain-containing protein [Cellulosimicrobium composti]|uniref:Nucleotidyltransferase n=1 Tax=Cellulosimicrobium composti TaxID=2672572 RepID=A0ABX0BM99_9MICO|nr:nucleotidyltransferase [Cellulosimicrobium composti]NDO91489.1 nucleotidyltransferase [Cellulosimicrobium composti]
MSQASEIFEGLLANLSVDNADTITARRDEITKTLNREFRNLEGSTANRLMVGSFGRSTAIRGISDLDLLYILPGSIRGTYEQDGGPSKVLSRTRKAIQDRYPSTSVTVDRLVVVVQFASFMFEVQPVFANTDDSFSYPDTYSDSWKITKPRAEIKETSAEDERSRGNLRRLSRLARAWKNKHGVAMGGLLIDTLAYNFLRSNTAYRTARSDQYGEMARDFFWYLSQEDDHEFYAALGSRQRVRVKKKFQRRAKAAYDLAVLAVSADGNANAYKKWRAVFGKAVPVVAAATESVLASASRSFSNTEQFIEDRYPVDIRFSLSIDCSVVQDGFRPQWLRTILDSHGLLRPQKDLRFQIIQTDVPGPYVVKWKVLNRGPEAERRDNIRGQIIDPSVGAERRERTQFRGEHLVECYIIKNGVVVARDSVIVPISAT